MDEFRKPYEYEEEKRGVILLFVIMLISVDIFLTLSYTVQVYGILKHIPTLGIGFMVIGILFILFILFTAITCYKLKKNMVTIAKTYLIVRAVFTICSLLIVFFNSFSNESMIGNGTKQYRTVNELIFTVLLAPLAYDLVFSIAWYLYFLKSKRCKELVNRPTNI
ncbi:MAG: hypothetical protein K0S01_2491 [Herbinix sp.]|jgi:hypothetical protein|nr:hypothetical protein [Herbinix sp.]